MTIDTIYLMIAVLLSVGLYVSARGMKVCDLRIQILHAESDLFNHYIREWQSVNTKCKDILSILKELNDRGEVVSFDHCYELDARGKALMALIAHHSDHPIYKSLPSTFAMSFDWVKLDAKNYLSEVDYELIKQYIDVTLTVESVIKE
jgi:hypothetical protein